MAENFTPGETIPLTASPTAANAAFVLVQSIAYTDCMVTNAGAVMAFVGFGAIPAQLPAGGVANATPVPPGGAVILRKGNNTICSALTASGTAQLYFTAGQGN